MLLQKEILIKVLSGKVRKTHTNFKLQESKPEVSEHTAKKMIFSVQEYTKKPAPCGAGLIVVSQSAIRRSG
jgi:hypothetical protein